MDRPERWVRACVAAPLCPPAVPPYVADYAARCAEAGVEPFRPAELWRGFAAPGVGAARATTARIVAGMPAVCGAALGSEGSSGSGGGSTRGGGGDEYQSSPRGPQSAQSVPISAQLL